MGFRGLEEGEEVLPDNFSLARRGLTAISLLSQLSPQSLNLTNEPPCKCVVPSMGPPKKKNSLSSPCQGGCNYWHETSQKFYNKSI
jgi:hypothetical protein